MFREITPLLIALTIALIGGIYLTDRVTAQFDGFGKLEINGWAAHPNAGSSDADPYSRARAARTGRIALGSAEGLVFVARTDGAQRPILATCTYAIVGKTPSARAWTLRASDDQYVSIGSPTGGAFTLHSGNVLRNQAGDFKITFSSTPSPGNWLQSAGVGQRYLIITLYDTSVASTTGISDFTMPSIDRVRCND